MDCCPSCALVTMVDDTIGATTEEAKHVRWSVMVARAIRLQTYMNWQGQVEPTYEDKTDGDYDAGQLRRDLGVVYQQLQHDGAISN